MNIAEMHMDFTRKFNVLSQFNNKKINTQIIDQLLNEAIEIFVKKHAIPKNPSRLGIEVNQRAIDNIRTILVEEATTNITNNIVSLPENYLYYVSGVVKLNKGDCLNKDAILIIQQHNDNFKNSYFNKSSFEWRRVNGVFNENGIKLFPTEDFTIASFLITYIKYPDKVNFSENVSNNGVVGYKLPNGVFINQNVDCNLPDITHSEVVDTAILLANNETTGINYRTAMDKVKLNELN